MHFKSLVCVNYEYVRVQAQQSPPMMTNPPARFSKKSLGRIWSKVYETELSVYARPGYDIKLPC